MILLPIYLRNFHFNNLYSIVGIYFMIYIKKDNNKKIRIDIYVNINFQMKHLHSTLVFFFFFFFFFFDNILIIEN